MAKKFMYVAIGVSALTAAYHLGAARTVAQGTGSLVTLTRGDGIPLGWFLAMTDTGDVWKIDGHGPLNPEYMGNIFGGPINVESDSWGAVKGKFK